MTLQHEVVEAVCVSLDLEGLAQELDANSPLFGALPELDSMGVMLLVTELESRFGITIEDEEVTVEIFATVGTLAAFVEAKQQEYATMTGA